MSIKKTRHNLILFWKFNRIGKTSGIRTRNSAVNSLFESQELTWSIFGSSWISFSVSIPAKQVPNLRSSNDVPDAAVVASGWAHYDFKVKAKAEA